MPFKRDMLWNFGDSQGSLGTFIENKGHLDVLGFNDNKIPIRDIKVYFSDIQKFGDVVKDSL